MALRGINKVILVGHLGQDPEVRYLPNSSAVANITLATSESWRDKQTGETKDKTEWHRVVLFGKLAEIAGEYLRKGSQVYIEGQIRTRKWQDQNGQDRYTTEVVVPQMGGTMQMLSGKSDSSTKSWGQPQQPAQIQPQSAPKPQYSGETQSQNTVAGGSAAGAPMDFDDDIPFLGLGYGIARGAVYAI